jgi:hypothetical protein
MNVSAPDLEKNSKSMIHVQDPKTKQSPILTGETRGKTRGRSNVEIIQDNDGAGSGMTQCEEKGVFALCRVGRAIDENQVRMFQLLERLGMFMEIE